MIEVIRSQLKLQPPRSLYLLEPAMSRSRRLISLLISLALVVSPTLAASRQPPDQVEPAEPQGAEASPRRPQPAPAMGIDPRQAASRGAQADTPPWLEEVRAQRRALHEQRRAAHRARRDALESITAAQREERQEQMRRRQEEVREMIESERRLYLNRGPWLSPLIPAPPYPADDILTRGSLLGEQAPREPSSPQTGPSPSPSQNQDQSPHSSPDPVPLAPSDWNNLWYYRGW
jgi:TolA-binding protein